MFRTFFPALAAACVAMSASTRYSLDLNAMNVAFNQQLNAQMQANTQSIVQTNAPTSRADHVAPDRLDAD